jgi:uncharacterized membrane protein HdeD (DUF308 family)
MATRVLGAGGTTKIPWWVVLLEGIAAVVIGLLLLTQPAVTLLTLVVFLGLYLLIAGIVDLVSMFVDRSQWGWKLAAGVLGIFAGVVIVRHPLWATVLIPAVLVWVLGAFAVVMGLVRLAAAFTGAGWGAGILGVLSIILGLILLLNPIESTVVLVLVAAIWAIVGGGMAIVGSFWVRGTQAGAGRPGAIPGAPQAGGA